MAAQVLVIRTNAHLIALENVFGLSMVDLETLDALRSAPEMYQRLHTLVRLRNWTCVKLPILEGLSVLARSIESIRLLLPTLLPAAMPNPVLHGNGSILPTIALIKYQGGEITRAKNVLKFRAGGLARQARKLGALLYNELDRVLDGRMPMGEFQARIPVYLIEINNLLNSRMDF